MNTLKDYVNFKLTHADKVASAEGYPLTMEKCKKYKKMKQLEIYGNSIQDGTPTPDAPVEVQSVGEKSVNLATAYNVCKDFDYYTEVIEDGKRCVRYLDANTTKANPFGFKENTQYTVSFDCKLEKGQWGSDETTPTSYTMVFHYADGTMGTVSTGDGIALSVRGVWYTKKMTSRAGKTVVGIGTRSYMYQNYNYIDVDTFQVEEGATATSYEPYGKYKIPVVQRGINYFSMAKTNATTQTINGLTFTPLGDERVHIKGKVEDTSKSTYYTIPIKSGVLPIPKGKYTIKDNGYSYETLELLSWISNGSTGLNIFAANYKLAEITTNSFISNIKIHIPANSKKEELDDVLYIQIERDVKNSPYEPYIEPITTNIYLDEPLRKIGNYADYLDYKNNKIIRSIHKRAVVSSDASWWQLNINREDKLSIYRENIISNIYVSGYQILCELFPYKHWNNITGTDVNLVWCAGVSAGFYIDTNLISGYDYSWADWRKKEWFLKWAESIGLHWYLARKTPIEEPLNIDLPKLTAKTTIIEVDTNLAPSNIYGKYIKR